MKFSFKVTFLSLALLSNISFGQSTGVVRSEYIRGFVPSCISNQKTLPENKGISLQIIQSYCKCSAEVSANNFTNQQIAALENLDANSLGTNKAFSEVMSYSTKYCAANYKNY
jgi:hypothetical protein